MPVNRSVRWCCLTKAVLKDRASTPVETGLSVSRLAAIHFSRGFDIDRLFADTCRELAGTGLRLGGLLQVSSGGEAENATSVHLVDVRTRASYDIWEDRGALASGCRLDEAGLLQAAHIIDRAIEDRVDLIVVNRFGRAESEGRGLRPFIASAIEAEIAVLTCVREPYIDAWQQFHGGLALALPPQLGKVTAWAGSK